MFNLDRLKHLAEQAVVLASGAVQQAENAIEDAVRSTDEPTKSTIGEHQSVLDTQVDVVETKSETDVEHDISHELAQGLEHSGDEPVVIKCAEDTAEVKADEIPKSEDALRADKAEALSRKLAHAFKTQKLQLEKQALMLEKLTVDCARLAEEKRSAELALHDQLNQHKELKETHSMLVSAKDEQITGLLKEGEQLSKKHGMLIESIRKLRKELTDRDHEVAELKARKGAGGGDFQSSVLAALGLLQQRQVEFHTQSQHQLAQILAHTAGPVSQSPVLNLSPSQIAPNSVELFSETLPPTTSASEGSSVDKGDVGVPSGVEPESDVEEDGNDNNHIANSNDILADSECAPERLYAPDDIDDEMYNLAYPKPQE